MQDCSIESTERLDECSSVLGTLKGVNFSSQNFPASKNGLDSDVLMESGTALN